jgi:hypothetical protein
MEENDDRSCQDRLGADTTKTLLNLRTKSSEEERLFFELPYALCLSRACLGKMFVII